MSSWKLVSEKGNQEFTFPAGTALAPGGTLKIATGPDTTAGQGVLVWTRKNIWNNNGDPGAIYNSGGKLVSRYPR
ncbi:lamin tail domain-containing protein [Desulforamulus ferrireducens]|uniref:lamin tail domain-containing protein n=1 Tax=Desulforamulus ferrireducens TaxID=1833852 RepID=UPI00098AE605|nr:lamin tail domain-containing protein [Desulforamulus ferrireducens]